MFSAVTKSAAQDTSANQAKGNMRQNTTMGVATNDNRTNTQGTFGRGQKSKASQQISNVIPAGGTLPLPITGTNFYLLLATAPVNIRPSGGTFDLYSTGQGLALDEVNAFDQLEIQNPNAAAIVFTIFVGWDNYIDKRLILANQSIPQVIYPTYDNTTPAANIDITDRGGQVITDINANQWYALYRVAILAFNPDSGVTFNIQKAGSVVANGPAIGVVYPLTSLRLDINGNYRINVGGGNINAVISEIYAAIPKV